MSRERKIIGHTTQCIVCLKDAKIQSGHVRRGNEDVIATWCDEHNETYLRDYHTNNYRYLLDSQGCYGGWHESYGFEQN